MPIDRGENSRPGRTAVLVLGMHRSGTSAVSRVMNILGATLPAGFTPKSTTKAVGRVEPMDIVDIHDRLLKSAGTSWADWNVVPEHWYRSDDHDAFLSELQNAISAAYAGSDLFLVQDPRIARFVPLWLDLLARQDIRPVAVLPYRNPIEVALSLNARDGFPREHGFLLWLRHLLEAEVRSRDLPRTFVSYDKLLTNRQVTTYRLIEALPITWPRKTAAAFDEITGLLDSSLRHSTATREDLALNAGVNDQIRGVYDAYERLEHDPQDRAAMERLDVIRAEFDAVSDVMSATFRSLRERFEQDRQETRRLRDSVDALTHECAVLRGRIDTLDRDGEQRERERNTAFAALGERVQNQAQALQTVHASLMRVRADQDVVRHRRERDARNRWRLRRSKKSAREDRIELVLRAGLFDAEWYAERYMADAAPGTEPIGHFIDVGSIRHFSPGPLFDAQWYVQAYPDVAGQGVEPLFHYLSSGMREGRLPLPS